MNLLQVERKKRFTRIGFSRLIGINDHQVSRYESTEHPENIPEPAKKKMAEALGMGVEVLFNPDTFCVDRKYVHRCENCGYCGNYRDLCRVIWVCGKTHYRTGKNDTCEKWRR